MSKQAIATAAFLALVSFPTQARSAIPEIGLDAADLLAATYFKKVAPDGNEHLLVVCNGAVRDISLNSNPEGTNLSYGKLYEVLDTCTSLVFIHNHPSYSEHFQKLRTVPSWMDFGMVAVFSYEVWKWDPHNQISFRVYQNRTNKDPIILEYGIMGSELTTTINSASAWRAGAPKGDMLAQSESRSSLPSGALRTSVSLEWLMAHRTFKDSVMANTMDWIMTPCEKPLFYVEDSMVCPNENYYTRVRGVVPTK